MTPWGNWRRRGLHRSQPVLSQFPGLSERYPAKYDVFGEAVKRYNYGNNTILNAFFNPATLSHFEGNPGTKEMMAMFERSGSSAAFPNVVPKKLTINGKEVQLDNEQIATYQRYVGRLGGAVVTRMAASPQFARLPDHIKQSWMTNLLGAVNEAAKVDLFGEKPAKITPGGMHGPSIQHISPLGVAEMLRGRGEGLNKPVERRQPIFEFQR
jgi:hypothetical protein